MDILYVDIADDLRHNHPLERPQDIPKAVANSV
jgi:hypothetical protein